MRRFLAAPVVFALAAAAFGQEIQSVCPKHIEVPRYPAIGRTAHVAGKIQLHVTIDAAGKVIDAQRTYPEGEKAPPPYLKILEQGAIQNIRLWTFAPASANSSFTIVYDYEFDPSLGGCDEVVTKVNFDLPDLVTISASLACVEP